MRLTLTTLLTLIPLAAGAGGHGAFYICAANGMAEFEIEVAAQDCTVNKTKTTRVSEDPMICDFGSKGPGKVTMQSNLAVKIESGGKTFQGNCRSR